LQRGRWSWKWVMGGAVRAGSWHWLASKSVECTRVWGSKKTHHRKEVEARRATEPIGCWLNVKSQCMMVQTGAMPSATGHWQQSRATARHKKKGIKLAVDSLPGQKSSGRGKGRGKKTRDGPGCFKYCHHTSIKWKFIGTKVASFSFVGGPDGWNGLYPNSL